MHGAIDGFSRCILFLQCSDNNKSSTVLHLFRGGIRQYGLPKCIRCDAGGENVKVRIWLMKNNTQENDVNLDLHT